MEVPLRLVQIESFVKRKIETLSDGERQKVMIAKALAQDTPIILLDEPTAFLDFPSRVEIMQLLRRLSRETQKTILLSTHDMELTMQLADKLWLMKPSPNEGKKHIELKIGTPEDLILQGEFTNYFTDRDLSFDSKKGVFALKPHYTSTVYLMDSSDDVLQQVLIKKALNRINVRVEAISDTKTNCFPILHIENDSIKITASDMKKTFCYTIEEVISCIKDI